MSRARDGTDVPVPQLPAFFSTMDSPSCFLLDFEEVGGRPTSTMEANFEVMLTKRLAHFQIHFAALVSIPMLVQGFTRFENTILSLAQSVAYITNKISNVDQAVDGVAVRVAALEVGAASASSGSGSESSWNVLGHGDGSTATGSLGSHGPGSSDDNRNTKRRFDTFSSPEKTWAECRFTTVPM